MKEEWSEGGGCWGGRMGGCVGEGLRKVVSGRLLTMKGYQSDDGSLMGFAMN